MADGSPRLKGFDYTTPGSYFITFRVCSRQPAFRAPAAASIARDLILRYRERKWYGLHAYCVMPDHIHMVARLQSDSRPLSDIVGTLKATILHRCRMSGHSFLWQRGYHDHIVREYEKSDATIRYTLENPIRAGLVADFRDYPYSGILDPWY